MAVKYVFVTGGVVSGLGKGITAASLGRLLKARGYQVTMQKFDPYINIDPGTMNPIQHGEVFVTDDGTETDLDLGHYERFIDESLDKNSNVTTGKIYWSVLQKERHGDFGGGTVQVIPHITNEIKSRFYRAKTADEDRIAIIEVGGTVGDIESQPFLESIRQFQHDVGHDNAILIHVTLIPYLRASGEMKTKPTQASVKELQGMGIQPDVLVCRSEYPLTDDIRGKMARAEEKSKQNFPLSGNFSARAKGIRRNMKKRSAVHRARHSVYVHAAARRCFWSASSDRSGVGQLPPVNFRFHYGRLNIRSRSPTGTTARPAGSGPATAGTAGRRLLSWWALPTASFHRWSR